MKLFSWDVIGVRLVSLMVPAVCIAAAPLFTSPQLHWTFLLVMSTLLGYMHFSIATFYQVKGLQRSPHRKVYVTWFLGLFMVSSAIVIWCINNNYVLPLGIVTIGYFLLHVLANEHTFLSRATDIKASYWSFIALVLPIGAWYVPSLLHPSLFFSYDLQYYGMAAAERASIMAEYFNLAVMQMSAVVLTAVFTLVLPAWLWWRHKAVMSAVTFLLTGLATLALLLIYTGPVVFVYVLHTVLVYHFVLLSLLFLKPMMQRGKEALRTYVVLHMVIIIPLTVIGYFFMRSIGETNWLDRVVNFQAFIYVSIVHITVSLINEPWSKAIINKLHAIK